ncbi:MAG: carboxylating nicotinate-nucleotide diphosphorylase [Dissulfurispiraceae bacterium]|nr:carboxylating nicotinate-nucleotide diphosphorylase [Dissulfurispiraceae bacterium]
MHPEYIKKFLVFALEEDIGSSDITSELTVSSSVSCSAEIIAKEECMVAGIPFVELVFNILDPGIKFENMLTDGSAVSKGDLIGVVSGNARAVLAGERLALNILQRLCGIATLTNRFVDAVRSFDIRVTDTRKTTPGMRYMEKYAVRIGGGYNHRSGLYDGILIKDNHVKVNGSISKAVSACKKASHLMKIEIEASTLDEVKEALNSGADVIMLDNMNINDMESAVQYIKKRTADVLVEASGNVTLDNIGEIASTGVDLISSGALTHSAKAADISMNIKIKS